MSQDTIRSEPVSRLLQGKNFGCLATLMPDGSPQVTPTWLDIEGDYIIVNIAQSRLKHKNFHATHASQFRWPIRPTPTTW